MSRRGAVVPGRWLSRRICETVPGDVDDDSSEPYGVVVPDDGFIGKATHWWIFPWEMETKAESLSWG